MSVFHDEVEIEDFEYEEDEETYYYPCPCGDRLGLIWLDKVRWKGLDQFMRQCIPSLAHTDYHWYSVRT